MITRRSLADEIDIIDKAIADLNGSKRECFDAYREQLGKAGVGKENIKLELDATKAAIKRRRAVVKDEMAVHEKDALVDEIFAEITAKTRAPRTRVEFIGKIPHHDQQTGEVFDDQPDTKSVADDQVRSEAASSSSAGTVVGCGNEPAASSSDAIACANPQSTGALLAGGSASPEHAFDKSPATNSMQEPHDEAQGQGGVIEHRREEGSQPRLPGDRAEITPDAPAVIAGDTNSNPSEPTSSPDRDEPDAGAAVSGGLSDDDIPAFLKSGKRGCLKLRNGHCKLTFETSALCSECQHKRLKEAA